MEIPFLDFGKPFIGDTAGEFVELAYTENFANNPPTARNSLESVINIPRRTTIEDKYKKGMSLLVVCKPTEKKQLQYSLLQPRSENEYKVNIKKEETGRFFFQRRHMLVKQADVVNDFISGYQPFARLHDIGCKDSGTKRELFTYAQSNNLVQALSDQNSINLHSKNLQFLLSQKILALSNILIEAMGVYEPDKNQVRVIGDFELQEKLEIVDAVQRLVYHKLNWICFATDYVSTTSRSDPMTVLFLESEEESDKVPAPARGFRSVVWKDLDKVTNKGYFDNLQELKSYDFDLVNQELFNLNNKGVNDIINAVANRSIDQTLSCQDFINLPVERQRAFIRESATWLGCLVENSSQFQFWNWLDLLAESQRPSSELSELLLEEKGTRFLEQSKFVLTNQKTWEILNEAFENGKQKDLLFLIEQMHSLRKIVTGSSTDNLKTIIQKYIERFDYGEKIYNLLQDQRDIPPLGNYILATGLVAAIVMKKFQDIKIWVNKTKDGKVESPPTGTLEILRMHSRKGSDWIEHVIPLIEQEVGNLDHNLKKRLEEEFKKLVEEPSTSSKAYLEYLAKAIEHFLNDHDPYKRTLDYLYQEKITPNEIQSDTAALFILATAKEYESGANEDKEKLLQILDEIRKRPAPPPPEPEKLKEAFFSKIRTLFGSLVSMPSRVFRSVQQNFRKLLVIVGPIVLLVLGIIILPKLLSNLQGSNPIPTDLPTESIPATEITEESVSATIEPTAPPSETPPPAQATFGVTTLPIGILVYESIEKNTESGEIVHPIRYISVEKPSPTNVDLGQMDGTDLDCMSKAVKSLHLYKYDSRFLLLSMAFPCGTEYRIAARMYMDFATLGFVREPGVGRNTFINAQDLLSVPVSNVDSVRLPTQEYVSFLASKDKETTTMPYWIVHSLNGSQAAFSFLEAGDGQIPIDRKNNLAEATQESAYNILDYEWINDNAVLFLLERGGRYAWAYTSFSLGILDVDVDNPRIAVPSSQDKPALDFSLNEDGYIALIYTENETNHYQLCQLNSENHMECHNQSVPLVGLKDIYQIQWSPDKTQVAITASTASPIAVNDSTQLDCLFGCLFLAVANSDGSLGELQLVSNISGINQFWWIDHTLPVAKDQ